MVEFRQAVIADASAIGKIITSVWQDTPNHERIRHILARSTHYTCVAVQSEQVVGFVNSFMTLPHRWELDLLAVHPAYHGRGIGQGLIQQSDATGRRNHAQFSRALVQVANQPMIHAITQQGYKSDKHLHTLYTRQGAFSHGVAVQTLTYQGVWLETEITADLLGAITPSGDVIGTVIDAHKTAQINLLKAHGFTHINDFYWWTKPLERPR